MIYNKIDKHVLADIHDMGDDMGDDVTGIVIDHHC